MITEVPKARVTRNGLKGGNIYPSGETAKSFQVPNKLPLSKIYITICNQHYIPFIDDTPGRDFGREHFPKARGPHDETPY